MQSAVFGCIVAGDRRGGINDINKMLNLKMMDEEGGTKV
jgi:hypothetical protein